MFLIVVYEVDIKKRLRDKRFIASPLYLLIKLQGYILRKGGEMAVQEKRLRKKI